MSWVIAIIYVIVTLRGLSLLDINACVFLNCNSVAFRDIGGGNLFSVRRTFRMKVPVLRDVTSSGLLTFRHRASSL